MRVFLASLNEYCLFECVNEQPREWGSHLTGILYYNSNCNVDGGQARTDKGTPVVGSCRACSITSKDFFVEEGYGYYAVRKHRLTLEIPKQNRSQWSLNVRVGRGAVGEGRWPKR